MAGIRVPFAGATWANLAGEFFGFWFADKIVKPSVPEFPWGVAVSNAAPAAVFVPACETAKMMTTAPGMPWCAWTNSAGGPRYFIAGTRDREVSH